MNALARISMLLSVAVLACHSATPARAATPAVAATVRFEENRGQAAAGIRFLSRGSAATLAFERDRVLVRLRDGSDLAIEVDQPRLLRVQLAAALAASRSPELEPAG